MGSDACFRMGSAHAICQDYAVAGVRHDLTYAIVSDGCSGMPIEGETGGPYTDYGSRLLARAAQLALPVSADDFNEVGILRAAESMSAAANLPISALDATLLVAVKHHRAINVYQVGDGVVAARNRATKQVTYTTVKYDNNMPYYLNYLRLSGWPDRYLRQVKSMTVTKGVLVEDKQWREASPEVVTEISVDVNTPLVRRHYFNEDHDLVLIMTDGAESFMDSDNRPVSLPKVIEQLFAIKSYEGEFVTRRCNRFLKKFCTEKGWSHSDDLSVAGICVSPEGAAT